MGELLKNLTEQDKHLIDGFISKYVARDHADVDYLLRVWDKEKPVLYQMFGNQFILNKQIEYNKPIKTLVNELNDRFNNYDSVCNIFRRNFDKMLWENRIALGYDYDLLQSLMDTDKLVKTEYDGDTFFVKSPEGKEIKVQHGCKPMRLISKICRLYGMDLGLLENFQNEVSQVLNQKTLKGDLSISIHPLDYMTMSENECGWNSCMNWSEPGCYCRGTVEMMNSPVVVVAYLNAADKMSVPGGQWSNKKWRELFVVTPSLITGVKGYPYQNEELVKIVNSWLRDLAVANLGWNFNEENFAYKHAHDSDEFPYIEMSCNTMYNDFGTIDYHYGILGSEAKRTIRINYSGAEECMECGSTDSYFDNEGCLSCEDCDGNGYIHCYDCGDRIYEEDAYYLDDEPYCEACYNNLAEEDKFTGEMHNCNNMNTLYLVRNGLTEEQVKNAINGGDYWTVKHYDTCPWNRRYWCTYFNVAGALSTNPNSWWRCNYVTMDMLTDAGWDLFELDKDAYMD